MKDEADSNNTALVVIGFLAALAAGFGLGYAVGTGLVKLPALKAKEPTEPEQVEVKSAELEEPS